MKMNEGGLIKKKKTLKPFYVKMNSQIRKNSFVRLKPRLSLRQVIVRLHNPASYAMLVR